MSSRKGSVVTGESLLVELKEVVLEKMAGRDLPEGERAAVAEAVAVAAIKYAILKQTAGKDIIFEKEKALSFEGDSGPYLQYARVRACSVLHKAENAPIAPDAKAPRPSEVSEVERLLLRFPEAVARSAEEYDPHHLATYLTELAGAFNSYYAREKIVDMSSEAPYKIALTKAFEITMRKGLSFLGIEAPNRM
jgi:arginyl-tRNA synthetase